MKPTEIITKVTDRFDVLYFNDPAKLVALMDASLGMFEDKGCAIKSIKIEDPDTSVEKPENFLAIASVQGSTGLYVDNEIVGSNIEISGSISYPVAIKYFVKFRGYDHDTDLPDESVGLITEHFEACLTLKNTKRERNMALAAGLQVELPSEESLIARVDAVELAIEETSAIIPTIMVA